jgi:hypothetical protein
MADKSSMVKQNYVAIVVAAVVSSILQAGWNTYFFKHWLSSNSGAHENLQYAVILIGFALIAATISQVTQLTGALTAMRGLKVGAYLWLGLVLPAVFIKHTTGGEDLGSLAPEVGIWLLAMLASGAIVGALNRKTK